MTQFKKEQVNFIEKIIKENTKVNKLEFANIDADDSKNFFKDFSKVINNQKIKSLKLRNFPHMVFDGDYAFYGHDNIKTISISYSGVTQKGLRKLLMKNHSIERIEFKEIQQKKESICLVGDISGTLDKDGINELRNKLGRNEECDIEEIVNNLKIKEKENKNLHQENLTNRNSNKAKCCIIS